MTSHELAQKLLEQPDIPVVLYDEHYSSYVPLNSFLHMTVDELGEYPEGSTRIIRVKEGHPHLIIGLP
jgi:hypothetical protein